MREQAEELLKTMLGEDTAFRDGQWEAIELVVAQKERTLLVQRTGWGKSIVYFIATGLLRAEGKGITLLISPLLSLMRNQIEMAERIGTRAVTINSNNPEEWDAVKADLQSNKCDILLISPERLASSEFNEFLASIPGNIGMLVIDEAHCISDWGHDFRPDYRRIVGIIENLPAGIPVLATTATANDRVVNDIREQLGYDLKILRGPLARESLRIQTIALRDQAERLVWLAENIPRLPGTGIIYCLTVTDCSRVATWLKSRGLNVYEYHAKLDKGDRIDREQRLINNEVKALVATVALGMGFDKPDLGFVIHYQRPGSLVAYYQQIGRAGRNLDNAYAILLSGGEDPYPNVEYSEVIREKNESKYNDSVGVVLTEEKMKGKSTVSSIKSATLNNWYSESKALACILETDCFAYIENKLCIYDNKYIQRDENGRMFLTNYAKEHEEECFLQFIIDNETGELHYVTLPAAMASKSFNYYDEINEDLLKQYGLVNEISHEMLLAINGFGFGDALTKLMSKNICNYSVRLLKDTTGLDNRTISNMKKGDNLTKLNVISACLGIHIPFRVSNKMLQLAELSLNFELPGKKGEENSIYDSILHLKWATDYEDVYEELKEQSYEYLLHRPK